MLISFLAATLVAPAAVSDHGKLDWFEGSYEAALQSAAASKKLIFLDFWTEW